MNNAASPASDAGLTEPERADASWLPSDFAHPLSVDFGSGIFLRPIRATDVDIDLFAVRANHELLWAQYGEAWGWPPEQLSRESDREDLARHAEEAERHESFNYAILSAADGTLNQRLLGCVYIDPPQGGAHAQNAHSDGSACEAEVSWWCVGDAPTELSERLGAFVREWIAAEWPFASPCTPFNVVD